MLALIGDPPPCLLVEQLFLERLPEGISAQLVDAKMEDHRQLARRAETLWAVRDRGTSNDALQRRPPQGQRKATTPTTSSDQLCYCHHTFGDLARHCQHPCQWQGKVQVRSSIVALATSLNDSLFLV